ncbi:saccharopine dehydrogenase family protein [Halosimplex halophilum]|uniref:saccharopine dehydrogenase family protein n=1 Tax=Halosimplex halophilum TaxID=2559572 RepID=UPI00107EECFB|nr:saccharopine dehydrogenase NADP-binding domain-containing protein [Halosimplex halophilum]
MEGDLLVYGAYGYTGSLITERAVADGLDPILAGRSAERVEAAATERGCDHRVFSLEHPTVVERMVADVDAVLNCAGPFEDTAEPLIDACLRAGTDYLDLAGNVDVLEATAARDAEATEAGVAVVPGVGFDVVPTDCLAAILHGLLPDAEELTLAIDGLGTFSPGTVKSMLRGLDRPGAVRRDGRVETVPVAYKRRTFEFPTGERTAVTVPWGDVSSAYYSTGIPNIEVYAGVPDRAADVMERTRRLVPLLAAGPVRRAAEAVAGRVVSGPTAEERAGSETHIWGEVVEADGTAARARMRTPNTYDLTTATAVEAARRVLDGEAGDGFQTPASAFGPEFAEAFEGVEREILTEPEPERVAQ